MGSLSALKKIIEKAESKANEIGMGDRPIGVSQSFRMVSEKTDPQLANSIKRRIALIDECAKSATRQQEELEKCNHDPLYWIANWVWTYDPRRVPATIPFDLFPKQAEYLDWLRDRVDQKESGIVEKSRDAGLTWLCGAFAIHRWLFVPGSKIAFGSRKQDLVDRLGDPDSIFEKFRALLRSLPHWMLPKSYSTGYLKFLNNENGNSITGEAGDQMGRGGRSSIYFLDEFAFVERPQRVDAAVSENTDVVIYVSTPNGPGNSFAKKRFSGRYPVFRIHWTDDPRKTPEWYAKRKATLDPVILAQEIDIDYNASIEGVCIPSAWVQSAINMPLTRVLGLHSRVAGLDVADEGVNKNVLIIRFGPAVYLIEDWSMGNTTQTAYKARDICHRDRVSLLNYDCIGVGAGVGGTMASVDYLNFKIQGINGGDSCDDKEWAEFDNRTSKQVFRNLRAQLWWSLRRRFEKTYERANGIADYPDDECISIPNHVELIAQLSQPLYRFNDSGLIVLESKIEMKRRGVESPDYADALAYAFAPNRTVNADWIDNL